MRSTPLLDCLVVGCKEQVEDIDMDIAIALLNAHTSTHAAATQGSGPGRNVEWVRPRVTQGMSTDSWQSFKALWKLYKVYTDLSEAESSLQLMQCCSKELLVQILQEDPKIVNKPEIEQLVSL